MRFSVILGAMAGLVAAAPAPAPALVPRANVPRSFKVERVANPNFTGKNTPKQLVKAHLKFGLAPPAALAEHVKRQEQNRQEQSHKALEARRRGGKHHKGAAATTTTTASANTTTTAVATAASDETGPATNTPTANDVEYLTPVTIGGQTLHLDFDTGSSDLWVFSTQLSARSSVGHTLFDATQSSSFAAVDGDLMIFGDVFFKSNFVACHNGNNTLGFAAHA